jgi:maleylpyruvate isomerase
LQTLATALTDQLVRRPSLLPGWTIGHVLTHLCRNADAHTGMLHAAGHGEVIAQYPGGTQQREADIQAGHTRPADQLRADILDSQRRLEQAWVDTTEEVWATGLSLVPSGPKTVAEQVFRRWFEVEIHLIDLGLTDHGGPDWIRLPAPFLDAVWEWLRAGLPARVGPQHTLVLVPGDRPSHAFGSGDQHIYITANPNTIVSWLLNRYSDPSWPTLAPWA